MIKAEVGQVFEEESISVWARSHGAFPRNCLQGSPACTLPSSCYGFQTFEFHSLALSFFSSTFENSRGYVWLNLVLYTMS